MGRSKTGLFLDRVVAAAEPAFDEVVAVQRADGEPLSIRTIREWPHPANGPVFGVARALEDAAGSAFILAVDYALVTTAVLADLRRRFEVSAAAMFVPVWREIPQTLCAGYAWGTLPLILRRIEERKLDLLGLMNVAGAHTFPFDGCELTNVNTQAELEEAEREQ